MKKICLLISALTIFLCGMIFTGCEGSVLDELTGPTDKWCYKEFSYGDDSTESATKFDCYCYYASSDKGVTMGSDSSNKATTVTLKKGLNIVIANNENSSNEIVTTATSGKTAFYLENISAGEDFTIEKSDGTTTTKNFKKIIWNLIYSANSWETYSDSTFPLTKSYTKYESVSSLKEGFNLSRILKRMAANKLIALLEADTSSETE